jgi:hypothetical protein
MALPENDILLIEKHIDGLLNDAEKRLFDQKYAQDPAFRHETEAYKTALKAVRVGGRQHILSVFEAEEAKIQALENVPVVPIHTPKYGKLMRSLAVAASLAVLIMAGYWLTIDEGKEKSGRDILASIAIDPIGNTWLTTARSSRDENEPTDPTDSYFIKTYGKANTETLFRAFEAYSSGEYMQAATHFSQVNITNDSLFLYKGISYLKADKADMALESLSKISQKTDAPLKPNAEWYILLAYLSKNDLANAKLMQGKIVAAPNHRYYTEAKGLDFK